MLQAMAYGYRNASAINVRALGRLIVWLRAAWIFFVASPAIGFVGYLATDSDVIHFLAKLR